MRIINLFKFKVLLSVFFINSLWANKELPNTYVDTLNHKGWMFNGVFDNISKDYVDFSSKDLVATLELGAGKGATAAELVKKRILLKNNSEVFINELSEEHLKIAVNEYPVLQNKMVKFFPGAFPEQLDFPEAKFNSILASRFFHYLTPDEWRVGLKKIFYWLKPGGKFYITTGTYFIGYQQNIDNIKNIEKKKKMGEIWPAYFTRGKEAYGPKSSSNLANLVDKEILERELKLVGFDIVKIEYVDLRKYLPASFCLDGREGVGAIVSKPR